jgi:hypothetical protein
VLEIERATFGVASRYLLRPDLYPTVDVAVLEDATNAIEAPQGDLGKEPTGLADHANIDQLAAALGAITEQRIVEAFKEAEIILKDVSEGAEDIIRNRPALSRWHPDYTEEFAELLTLDAPFRR